IVNLRVKPSDWMDAPILLITGSKDPKFTPDDIGKFREFIETGGMIFSTADDGSLAFTDAMRRYAGQVVNQRYEMRQLQKTHPLFSAELSNEIKTPPLLLGMSNGVREIWVHSTVDMGASWQMRRFAMRDHFDIPAALYFYATGKTPLRGRLKTL